MSREETVPDDLYIFIDFRIDWVEDRRFGFHYVITIDGSDARYESPHGSEADGKHFEGPVEFELDWHQFDELIETVEFGNLRQSVEEVINLPNNLTPWYTEIDAKAEIHLDGEQYELTMRGLESQAPAQNEALLLDHDKQAAGLHRICKTVKRWARTAEKKE